MKMEKKKQELALSVSKEEDISQWYTEVIKKAELIEYTDVAGCMIFRPNSYQIWEQITSFLDKKIKEMNVKNAYFPLFIPKKLLCREEEHVEGFAPEVAWVDYGGDTQLGERLAIRPTSETMMYDAYAKWIQSYRDLPLKLNQWCNVVRWEFKHATPFLRNREFLWQEGHTAFATYEEAEKDVYEALEAYRATYEELLALPVTLGRKSQGETFAGADFSLTAEPFSPIDGKAIQACTSHHLGQSFAKAFDIQYLDKDQKKQYVYQNSWGLSTRSIGSMIMIHGDDRGLIIPPRAAVEKLVIVPLMFKGKEQKVNEKVDEVLEYLREFNPVVDDDHKESAGFKYNKWELRGMPLRVEIGPRDVDNGVVQIVRRDTNEKSEVVIGENMSENISELLESMHYNLFNTAKEAMDINTVEVTSYEEFREAIENKKRCLVPWAEDEESEDAIKEETGAKSSCIPLEYREKSLDDIKCFYSGKPATCWAYFSKSH